MVSEVGRAHRTGGRKMGRRKTPEVERAEPRFSVKTPVTVASTNIRPWEGVILSRKFSPVSGWWYDVQGPDGWWVIPEGDLR
jgi:hypothetical protein